MSDRDMKEHRDTELELQETQLKLQRMSEFLTNLSHEVRTPLTALLNMCNVMQSGHTGPVTDDQLSGFNIIQNSGNHLLELIDEVLDLAKIESGYVYLKTSEIRINSLCESSLQLVVHKAKEKNIQLVSNISANLLSLYADEKRLRQMLVNLLDNAVKFTPEYGIVTIEVDSLNAPCQRTGDAMSKVRFSVTDTGIGIDESEYKAAFKPFVQIDTPHLSTSKNGGYRGTGVGLALVKQFAELHGGSVGVISKAGKGSCFYFDLPSRASNNVHIGDPLDFSSQTRAGELSQ